MHYSTLHSLVAYKCGECITSVFAWLTRHKAQAVAYTQQGLQGILVLIVMSKEIHLGSARVCSYISFFNYEGRLKSRCGGFVFQQAKEKVAPVFVQEIIGWGQGLTTAPESLPGPGPGYSDLLWYTGGFKGGEAVGLLLLYTSKALLSSLFFIYFKIIQIRG